jgi:hypothetical protein
MTKYEKKLKSMLNYFEIDLTGKKDEKLSGEKLNTYLNRFNQFMDYYILEEIIKNIKNTRENTDFEEGDDIEEDDDPMLPKQNNKNNKNNKPSKNDISDDDLESFDFNDPIDTDINKFLKWLTMTLYSGDHSVIITEDKTGINIKLVKINKGKK